VRGRADGVGGEAGDPDLRAVGRRREAGGADPALRRRGGGARAARGVAARLPRRVRLRPGAPRRVLRARANVGRGGGGALRHVMSDAADLMAVAMARLLVDGETVFHGVASPLPMVAILLARRLHAPRLTYLNITGAVDAR